jgi:type II secretory pathway pseudopilin PulG
MRRHRTTFVDEGGFTMVAVMISMMLLGLFAVSAWAAANGDMPIARGDQDRKRAYEAANAGVEWYAYQLQRDPSYWEKCASLPPVDTGQPAPVTLEGKPHVWRALSGSQAAYTVEILDKRDTTTGARTPCSTTDPSNTALQEGTLQIRATGRANGKSRSVIGTFRRSGFVDYIYFTQWETQDPIISGAANCDKKRSQRGGSCVTIQFTQVDAIKGPMHTNDESVVTCGTPTFGRSGKADRWEIAGAAPGYAQACGNYAPTFNGPQITPAGTLTLPDGNTELASLAGPDWTFSGQTCLDFRNDGQVDVYRNQNWGSIGRVRCDTSNGGTVETRQLTGTSAPPNGVIYVTSGGGSCQFNKYEDYTNSRTCGDVAVRGTYPSSLTIGAANDIVVWGNLTRVGDVMMGLIAANFVRVYHPMNGISSGNCGSNVAGFVPITRIDAAILALQHSFLVDNYHCGSPLGTLTVNGAIAQYYRGTVGTGNGTTTSTGYVKDYNYDDRLKFRSPPNFLDPIETRWDIVRRSEQAPAAK